MNHGLRILSLFEELIVMTEQQTMEKLGTLVFI
jgi:hypothetical protein